MYVQPNINVITAATARNLLNIIFSLVSNPQRKGLTEFYKLNLEITLGVSYAVAIRKPRHGNLDASS